MDKLFEKTVSSKEIYNGKIFRVTADEAELSDGRIVRRDVVYHPGGVVIVAEKDDDLLLVQQFRYPPGEVLYELPAGKLDKTGESPLEAAKRELEEETGFVAENWQSLGYVFSSPGFCSEKLYLFKASSLTFKGQNPDEGEILNYTKINKNEVFKWIKDGVINDSKTLAALMRAYFV